MKTYLLSALMLVLFTAPAYCDYIRASDTVTIAIESAQSGNEARFLHCINLDSLKKSKTNPLTKEQIITLFKSIDIKKIQWKDENAEELLVMTAPLTLSFVIESQLHKNQKPSRTYKVAEVIKVSSKQ